MDALIESIAEQSWAQQVAGLPDTTVAVVFFALLIVGAITQPLGRRLWTGPKKRQITSIDDPFAVAYAAGGINRSIAVAFMMLSAHGLVGPSAQHGRFIARPESTLPQNLSDVETATLAACKTRASSIKSVGSGKTAKTLTTALEKRALAAGLVCKKAPLGLRALWAAPILLAALFAAIRTATGIHAEQPHMFILIAACVAAGVWLTSLYANGDLAHRRLFHENPKSHPALSGASPITGAPAPGTYASLKDSPVAALAGLGGIAAVSSFLLYWSPTDNELLLAAEKASLASSTSGLNSDSGDSGGGDGGSCGGCGGCG